jgi:hypothetical protein
LRQALTGSAVFALIIQLVNQYNFIGRVFWDPAVAVSFAAMVIAGVFTVLTFRESFWFKVMDIESIEEEKLEELRAVVDDVLNQRMKREREDISA